MTRVRMGLMLCLLLAAALAVAACGGGGTSGGVASLGGSDTPTSSPSAASGNNRQAALAYARCMRQHGINMPDPTFDAAGHAAQRLPPGVGPDNPKFRAATQACQRYLPNGGAPERPNPQVQQQMLAFARCMRAQGINIPDPQPGGGIDVNGSAGVNPNSPKYKAAERACQRYQPTGGSAATQQSGASR